MTTTGLRRARLLVTATAFTVITLVGAQSALATVPATVDLGTAAPFAVLAATPAVTSTGATIINGDLGISPAAAVTGFPPGIVNGATHTADAVALQAQSDLTTAYTDAATRPATATHGTLGTLTLVAGVYNAGGVVLDLTGTLTLDGQNDPSSVWIFQATSSLVTAPSSVVKLINGASSCNVFWQVTSSATLGAHSTFVGTIMALESITMDSEVSLHGRALARNGDVTLKADTITSSPCFVGGSGAGSSAGPSAGSSAGPSAGSSARPTAAPVAGPTLPNTATTAPTDLRGSGPSPLIFVGMFLIAFLLVSHRLWLRSQRRR